jgi:hypothetical protein
MIHDFQIAPGDVCEDSAGLQVRVEDIDIYDYVHFSLVEGSERDDDVEVGQMSHVAFGYRFMKVYHTAANRKAA